jgi:hypothetical protein
MNDYLDNTTFRSVCNSIKDRLMPLGIEYDEPNVNNFWEGVIVADQPFFFINDDCINTSLKEKIAVIIEEVVSNRY